MDSLDKLSETILMLRVKVTNLVELCAKYEAENKRMQKLIKRLLDELEDEQDRNGRLMNEFIRVLGERDELRSKFEVSQSMRHAQYERYTNENDKLRELVREIWSSCPVSEDDCAKCSHRLEGNDEYWCDIPALMEKLGIKEDS